MFAPPPVQFTRGEIQSRIANVAQEVVPNGSPAQSSEPSLPLHRNDPRNLTSPRKRRFFGWRDKSQASAEVAAAPDRWSPSSDATKAVRPELEVVNPVPPGFAEHPRPVPFPPPRRSAATQKGTHVSALPGTSSPSKDSAPANGYDAAPPIPPKSSRRPNFADVNQNQQQQQQQQQQQMAAVGQPRLNNPPRETDNGVVASAVGPIRPLRPVQTSQLTSGNIKQPLAGRDYAKPRSTMSSGLQTGVEYVKVYRPSTGRRQVSTQASRGPFEPQLTYYTESRPRRATEGSIIPVRGTTPVIGRDSAVAFTNPPYQTPLSRVVSLRQRQATQDEVGSGIRIRGDLLYHAKYLDKELPDTPTSSTGTPTEVFEYSLQPHRQVLRSRSPKSDRSKRSPLAQIPPTNSKANSSLLGMSPGRLSAIPEYTTSDEESSLTSDASTPVATHIHLRGGSLVTVSPPELTPWQRTVYIQGPIKLPKPVIVPRKNSVASLEPFQDAIDQVYQDALNVPRRRSDDRVLDDVCDFFRDFGFEDTTFRAITLEEGAQWEGYDIERYSTPPIEPWVSPIEKTIAKDIVKTMSKQSLPSLPLPLLPEDRLQANDTAGLASRGAAHPGMLRKDSETLSRFDRGLSPLLKMPKEDAVKGVPGRISAEGSENIANRQLGDQGLDPDGEVEELDASSSWVARATLPRTSKVPSDKNSMDRVRRLVNTAGGVL